MLRGFASSPRERSNSRVYLHADNLSLYFWGVEFKLKVPSFSRKTVNTRFFCLWKYSFGVRRKNCFWWTFCNCKNIVLHRWLDDRIAVFILSGIVFYRELWTWLGTDKCRWQSRYCSLESCQALRDRGYDLLVTSPRCVRVGVKGTLEGIIVFKWMSRDWTIVSQTFTTYRWAVMKRYLLLKPRFDV